MEIIILDGKRMGSIAEAHAYLKKAMRLPDHYGANLDALADCLSEFGSHACVILINPEDMRAALGPYADWIITVFEEKSAAPAAFRWMVWET